MSPRPARAPRINLSPEPFSNWAASLAEDAVVPLGLWLAVRASARLFASCSSLALLAVVAACMRLLWRGLRRRPVLTMMPRFYRRRAAARRLARAAARGRRATTPCTCCALRAGDEVTLFNGRGGEYGARIARSSG